MNDSPRTATVELTMRCTSSGILVTDGCQHIVGDDSDTVVKWMRKYAACGYEWHVRLVDEVSDQTGKVGRSIRRERWHYVYGDGVDSGHWVRELLAYEKLV